MSDALLKDVERELLEQQFAMTTAVLEGSRGVKRRKDGSLDAYVEFFESGRSCVAVQIKDSYFLSFRFDEDGEIDVVTDMPAVYVRYDVFLENGTGLDDIEKVCKVQGVLEKGDVAFNVNHTPCFFDDRLGELLRKLSEDIEGVKALREKYRANSIWATVVHKKGYPLSALSVSAENSALLGSLGLELVFDIYSAD